MIDSIGNFLGKNIEKLNFFSIGFILALTICIIGFSQINKYDLNSDGKVDLEDMIVLRNYILEN